MFLHFLKNIPNVVLASVILIGCQMGGGIPDTPKNIFSDVNLQKIFDLQDRRDAEGLLPFFSHESVDYREKAALAFASVQDPRAIQELFSLLLKDNAPRVRAAAAYSLGQSYDSSATDLLFHALEVEDSVFVRKNILEAIGKCITMPALSRLNTYTARNDLEKEGLSWGLYRAALRNVYDGVSVETAIQFLSPKNTYLTRLGAAHFLGRTKGVDLSTFAPALVETVNRETNPFISMQLALALGKTGTGEGVLNSLSSLTNHRDYRVQVSAFRALGNMGGEKARKLLLLGTASENVHAAIAAAETLNNHFDLTMADLPPAASVNWRVWAVIAGGALKGEDGGDLKTKALINTIKDKYTATGNIYEKASLLTALGNTVAEYKFLVSETFSTKFKAVSTAGITALASVRGRDDFPEELEREFAKIFRQALLSGDLALIGIAADVLKTEKYSFREVYDNLSFLHDAKRNLSLPRDNEALQVLDQTIAFFVGEEYQPVKNEYNNPINWEVLLALPSDRDPLVRVSTTKGDIILRLLVKEAPGSVVNFLKLTMQGYYKDISIHRVVPNFVAQAGCYRGDGWGGEDFSIRSELGPLGYEEGTVGMASAGKDTEGTQWFITHSPTPHLDGKYTIFARVTDGMDIVHQLTIGDKIRSVELIEMKP